VLFHVGLKIGMGDKLEEDERAFDMGVQNNGS
jgi:hypothetical protein